MFRFKIYFETYHLVSSEFNSLEECNAEFEYQLMIIKGRGGGIEEFIPGIGWTVYEL